MIPADILHVLFEYFPKIPQPLATIGAMNVINGNRQYQPSQQSGRWQWQHSDPPDYGRCVETAFEVGLVIDATIANGDAQRDALWDVRETAPESHKLAGKVARSDVALPQSAIADFYADMVAGIKAIDPKIRICGYGHLGDGNLHFNLVQAAGGDPDFDAKTPELYDLLYYCEI